MSESFLDESSEDVATNSETNNADIIKRSDSEHDIKDKLEAMKQLVDRYEKQLQEERAYRQELEKSFEKRSTELENATQKLNDEKIRLEEKIAELEHNFDNKIKQASEKFNELAALKDSQYETLKELSNRYQRLTANYEKTANQLREEQIQLPETVDELQFECLRLREALIESRASKEHADEEYASEVEILNTELAQAQLLYRSLPQHSERRPSPENNELRQTIADLEKRLVESQNESIALSRLLEEYRQKCSQLQNELNTSEIVQKDFVKLSQQLQVQLEVIRQGDQELRWQFPDDIKKCNGCNVDLKHKVNCKHCGKVFCNKCTESVIQVGTNKANVCRVCETLLSRNSAPFFSSK